MSCAGTRCTRWAALDRWAGWAGVRFSLRPIYPEQVESFLKQGVSAAAGTRGTTSVHRALDPGRSVPVMPMYSKLLFNPQEDVTYTCDLSRPRREEGGMAVEVGRP